MASQECEVRHTLDADALFSQAHAQLMVASSLAGLRARVNVLKGRTKEALLELDRISDSISDIAEWLEASHK